MLSIVSTVGTTVFGKPESPLNVAVREWEVTQRGPLASIVNAHSFPGEDIYLQALADLHAKSGDFLRRASAEINAIEGIHAEQNVSRGNTYHFLASQTPKGALAARVLADFCRERYEAIRSEVSIIDGLQVGDERAFRLTGLPYLVETLYRFLKEAQQQHLKTVFNPTGGFKVVIPYMTLVGMLHQNEGVEVSCIHEFSTELITLAGLPITLDLKAIETVAHVLELVNSKQDDGVSRDELATALNLSPYHTIAQHPLWSLFEPHDDHFALSGLGRIALAEVRKRRQFQEVWLSEGAAKYFDRLLPGSVARTNYEKMFDRLRNPENRVDPYRHTYKGCKFPAFKLSGMNERLFFNEDKNSGTVLVLELTEHISDDDWGYTHVPTESSEYTPYRQWSGSSS